MIKTWGNLTKATYSHDSEALKLIVEAEDVIKSMHTLYDDCSVEIKPFSYFQTNYSHLSTFKYNFESLNFKDYKESMRILKAAIRFCKFTLHDIKENVRYWTIFYASAIEIDTGVMKRRLEYFYLQGWES